MDAKKYNNIKLFAGISKSITGFVLLFLFIYLGYSSRLAGYLGGFTTNNYYLLLLFTLCAGAAASVVSAPVDFYTDFYLEHKYNLSNQSFGLYIWENLKGILVGLALGLPLLMLFYYVLNMFNALWWLPFAIILFLLSVVLARVVPVLILPLFYKVTPLENDELAGRIRKLASGAGIKVENVFKFNMSKNTKKANAAFTGLGKSKRILLGDTLIEGFSEDEIETVIAHELGHYKRRHIIKNIFIGTASSFLTLFLIAWLYENTLPVFGFSSILEVRALPLIVFWGSVIGVIQTPLTNMLSRRFEYQADEYAIAATGKTDAFTGALEKLTDQNLGDKNPHPFVEWYFYSHPSVKKRIAAIMKFCEINNLK